MIRVESTPVPRAQFFNRFGAFAGVFTDAGGALRI
jgi:hypothetical protein